MAFIRRRVSAWQLLSRTLGLGERTIVMGVLNVTPDSFSDGGVFFSTEAAVEHAMNMLDDGADLIDIGGESTRPGSHPISAQQELDRVLPVVEEVLRERPETIFSIDTYRSETARAAVPTGIEIVNDVSAFSWDEGMARTCAELRCGVILMHTHGRPNEWRTQPRLAQTEVVPLVRDGLGAALAQAVEGGIDRSRIVVDPGYGFGKILDNNYPLLAHLDDLLALGQPLLAGLSRKSFLGRTLGRASGGPDVPVNQRGNATLAATTAAILAGASIIRVHEVRPAVEAARIADAILAEV